MSTRSLDRRATWGVAVGLGALALLTPAVASGSARNTIGAGTAQAEANQPLVTTLAGANEVPGPGDPDGSGGASVTVDAVNNEVCADLRVAGIDAATAAHIHRGAVGVAGDVVVTLTPPAAGTSASCVAVDNALALEIAGDPSGFYVNVHNAAFPNGALRGQLGPSTTLTGQVQLLPEPLRAYDSRTGDGPMAAGATRTISLASGRNGANATVAAVPPGATGAMVRLTLTETVGAGYVVIYSGALGTPPATSSANWYQTGATVGSDSTVAVDALGQIKVTAGSNTTQVVIDVVGYLF